MSASKLSKNVAIFFINLARAPERRDFMKAQLHEIGLGDRVHRVDAVDARTADLSHAGYVPSNNAAQWRMKPSEIAVFESHKRVWKRVVEENLDQALVLEDDIVFAPDAALPLKDMVNMHIDYDVIKLDGVPGQMRFGSEITEVSGLGLRSILQVMPSAAAYLISAKGAVRMLEISERYSEPIDLMMFAPRPDWQAFQVFPAISAQGMFLSTTTLEDLPRIILESERLCGKSFKSDRIAPPRYYRIKTKLRRRLGKIENKLWRDSALLNSGGIITEIPLWLEFSTYRS